MGSAIFFLLLVCVFQFTTATSERTFRGDKVIRLIPSTTEQFDWIQQLRMSSDLKFFDFWTEPRGVNVPVDIHVDKSALNSFFATLRAMKMEHSVTVNDLQMLIDQVDAESANMVQANKIVGTFARYDDIIPWLADLCDQHSRLASCGSIGTSFEGRDIRYIKLGRAGSIAAKQIIVIDAAIHAREWLAPATSIYLIDRLLNTYNSDDTAKQMLDTYDFIFIPLLNPDGYEYTQTTDRVWRKTRSTSHGDKCIGVDANSNFDISWCTVSASHTPCSDIYCGAQPFSEPETKALSDFLEARKNDILAYFSLHTYSQLWLIPYGDPKNQYPPDFEEMFRVAQIGGNALMAVRGETWQVGNIVDILYPASGGSMGWAKSIGIKYSYSLELRPNNTVSYGFVAPVSAIEPSGREVFAGLAAAIDTMQN